MSDPGVPSGVAVMIIGISGKIGTGKTTLSNLLLERLPGYERVAFGDCLKEETAETFGFPLEWAYSERGKAQTVEFERERIPYEMTVRELLQWYGTDVCRAADPDYWIKAMADRIGDKTNVIIDDVRFPDEAEFVEARGGFLVRLGEYPGWKPGPHANHASETALDSYRFPLMIRPDYGKLEQQAADVIADLVLNPPGGTSYANP